MSILDPMGRQIVDHDDVALRQARSQHLLDNASPFIGPSSIQGATMPSAAQGGREDRGLPISWRPRRQRPCVRTIFVEVPVSGVALEKLVDRTIRGAYPAILLQSRHDHGQDQIRLLGNQI